MAREVFADRVRDNMAPRLPGSGVIALGLLEQIVGQRHRRFDIGLAGLAASTLIVVLLLSTGLLYFRRVERTFADVI